MCVCVQYRDGLSKEAGPGLDECAASPRGLQFEQVRCRMSGALDGLLTNAISSVHCEVLQTLLCLPDYGGGVYSPGEVGRDHSAQECEILKSLHRVIIYVAVKVVCSVSSEVQDHLLCHCGVHCLLNIMQTDSLHRLCGRVIIIICKLPYGLAGVSRSADRGVEAVEP